MKRFGWRRLTCSLPRIVDSTRQSSRRTGHVYVAGSKVPRKRIALIGCWGGLGADGSLITKETWKRPNAKNGGRRVALHGGIRELQLLPKMMQVIRAKEWGLTIVSGGPLAAGLGDRG